MKEKIKYVDSIKELFYDENKLTNVKYASNKVPIKRGCNNGQCFCTGACNEIIGWRDKLPNEL